MNESRDEDGFPILEIECKSCQGYVQDDCYYCHGHGSILTPFGKKVMEMVIRRLRLTISTSD